MTPTASGEGGKEKEKGGGGSMYTTLNKSL